MLDAGIERKVVQKSGSYFSFGDERLGQGRHNATAFLREHPDVTQRILAALQAQLGPDQVVSARLLPDRRARGRREGARRGCRRQEAEPRAEDVALRALRAADRSRAELDARLEQRGFAAEERRQALDELERLGYLDDERTAATPRRAARRAGLRRRVHPRRSRAARASRRRTHSPRLEPESERAIALRRPRRRRGSRGAALRRRGDER